MSGVEVEGGEVAGRPEAARNLTWRQKSAMVAVVLVVGALLVARHSVQRPAQAANSPPPFPSLVAAFGYQGSLRDAVPGGREFALKVRAVSAGPSAYEIVSVRQEYPGITTALAGITLPATVRAGQPAEFAVVYRVADCAAAPRDAGLPFLDVTLRNTRAMQTLSEILGADYARDLSRNLHITCPDTGIRTSVPDPAISDVAVRYTDTALVTRVFGPPGVFHPPGRLLTSKAQTG